MSYVEESIASLCRERWGIEHPPDMAEIVAERADLREETLPVEADAIIIRKKSAKPVVFLSDSLSVERRTFTLAHELGHIKIPWHIGTFVCRPQESLAETPESYYERAEAMEFEREANRFAAEFLMPRKMIREWISDGLSPVEITERFLEAKISTPAITFKLKQELPSGFVFAILDRNARIRYSGKTSETNLENPRVGSDFDQQKYERLGCVIETGSQRNGKFCWIDTRHASILRRPTADEKPSGEILSEIIEELGLDPDGQNLVPSINGIIGAANSKHLANDRVGDLFTILKMRFEDKEHLRIVVRHRKFDVFLATKVNEIDPPSEFKI